MLHILENVVCTCRIGATTTALLLGMAASIGLAADFPTSGEASFDRYVTGKTVAVAETPLGKGMLWQETGVTRNVAGAAPFDQLEDVCLGHNTVIGEDWTRSFGTCVKTDKDGDKILVTWGETKDSWVIVGGTGKYKGITGTGTSAKFDLLQDRQSEWTGIGHEKISWQIK